MPIRLKDIARDLNVSTVTVSKAIRDQSDISSETKARVLRRMADLGYRPNLAARGLVTGRTRSIGLVVPSLLHPFFAEVAKGVVQVVRPQGYSVLISVSDEDSELEISEIEQLMSRQVDALLVASSQKTGKFFQEHKFRHSPFVFIDRAFPGVKASFVGARHEKIGFAATEHLIQGGCKRIAHFHAGPVSSSLGRFKGYKKALEQYGMPFRPELVRKLNAADIDGETAGFNAMNELLNSGIRIDGIFCFNDPVAAGALDAILQCSLEVPADVAVIGCGNSRWSRLLKVPLSTVDQNSEKLGIQAAETALCLINDPESPRRSLLLDHCLIARESTRPVPETAKSKYKPKRRLA